MRASIQGVRRLAAASALALALVFPASSGAAFDTGMTWSSVFQTGTSTQRDLWFDRTKAAGMGLFRMDVVWRSVAPAVRPVDPTDPAVYNWSAIDDSLLRAKARGMEVMFTVYRAPVWAEAPGRDPSAAPGAWKPDPSEFAAFGKALATRYDGAHGVPRVRYFEAWNEANLNIFLTPQWRNGRIVSDDHYRRMLNGFYDAVKSVRPDNKVLAAGTAPYGDDVRKSGQGRTRPLQFYRELMCLKRTRNKKSTCPSKAKFDLAAHHPINRSGSPRTSAVHPDDVTTPDVKNLKKALRYAERKHTILPSRKGRDIWATEIWIETNPPDKRDGVSVSKAGDWIAETLYLLWKQGVEKVINYRIQDDAYAPPGPAGEVISIQAGLWFHPSVRGGARKDEVFTAFDFPFVTERRSRNSLFAWGVAPSSGKLRIERRKGNRWQPVKTLRAKSNKVFRANLALRGKQTLRAVSGGQRSNRWQQKK